MNLEMIHMCLSLHGQDKNKATQDAVLGELDQLRQQVNQLALLSHRGGNDTRPQPTSAQRNASTALDHTHSRGSSVTSQGSSRRENQRTQYHNNQGSSSSSTLVHRDRSNPSPNSFRQSSPSNSRTQLPRDTRVTSADTQHLNDLQRARDLLNGGRIEQAKSLCRNAIHATDSDSGPFNPIHKKALELLVYIYESTSERKEVPRLRLLLDTPGRNTIRQEFKGMVQKSDLKSCLDYVLHWTLLLDSNAKLQTYRSHINGLSLRGPREPVLLAAVSMMGNSLLAQTLLAQGASIYSQVNCTWPGYKTITPLGCAIIFGHRHLVQTFLQSTTDDLDFIINTNCLEDAARFREVDILRMLLDHVLLLQRGLHVAHMASNRSFQATKSDKLNVGVLLSQKFKSRHGSQGNMQPLSQALHDAVDRKDLAMAKLLTIYGLGGTSVIKAATKARWVEGIQTLATDRNGVTEDDISYAFGQDLSIAKYLLSLNPSLATNCISHAMIGSGIEGLKLVLRMGANVNAPKQYPLHLAVRSKNSQMVQALLNAGADVHRKDGEGQTALQYAIKIGKNSHDDKVAFQAILDIISLLRKSGATASSSGGSSLGWGMSFKSRQLSAALRV